MRKKYPSILILAALILTGCKGGGNSSSANSSELPPSQSETENSGNSSSEGSSEVTPSPSEEEPSPSEENPSIKDSESSESSGGGESSSENPSTPDPDPDPDPDPVIPGVLGSWSGIEDTTAAVGHYFNVFEKVKLVTSKGVDISSYIEVLGSVDYGTLGTYSLTYKAKYNSVTETKVRKVTIADVTYKQPVKTKVEGKQRAVSLGEGSYLTGAKGNDPDNNFYRVMYNPVYMDAHLQNKPIPTNGWWTTLISQNYGGGNYYGGGNGIYLNPLRSSLGSRGVEITDVGAGWTQYNYAGINNDEKTAHTFSTFFQDILVKPSSLNAQYVSSINSYTDNNVKVALRNSMEAEDEAVVTYTQGSPYVFMEFKQKATIGMDLVVGGVTGGYNFYNINGSQITGDNFTGQSFVIELQNRHYGYGSYPYFNAGLGAALHKNSYFVVNMPASSKATFKHGDHPDSIKKNRVELSLGSGNYVSVATINSLNEAPFYATNGYAFMDTSTVEYSVNRETNKTTTTFRNNLHHVNGIETKGVLAIMPHQQKISSPTYTSYSMKTVRGTLKMIEGNSLTTSTHFSGVLPGFTLPTNSAFEKSLMKSYLQELTDCNVPDGVDNSPENVGPRDFDLIDHKVPYWNAKALYPLAQGVIAADQIGETALRDSMIGKIKASLTDWFTYSGPNDARYIYYDEVWGTTYYSNNEFNTGAEINDHHFTHGYLVFASAIVAMFDEVYYNSYKDIINFFLMDYASPKENNLYPVLRQFDHWAGHSWANGIGFFTDGNNQESSGEALNGWVAAYLIGQQNQDDALIDAAIYGYTNELNAIKTYWFDYDKNVFNENYGSFTEVAGIVFGGKYDYATWFGANPTFIYGIHWLPMGEYNTSYAIGSSEKARFTQIFNKYWEMSGGPNTWYSNIWAMKSLVNSSGALSDFNAAKIRADEYPNELAFTYYMVNAMSVLGTHSLNTYATISGASSSSVYETSDGKLVAMVWNPANTSETITFKTGNNVIKTVTVAANSFTTVNL